MSFLQRNHRFIFYAAWIFLGLMQSVLTELQDDEAYYWVYSRYPDWSYFDHPPMIAMLVKAGYAVFPNELGVRFFPFLLNIFTLVIIERLLDKKNPFLFYAIALSLVFLQLGGFMAIPDTALLFFTALFFLFYRNFTAKETLWNAVWLGISIALLFYCKYHAILIVFFTLLSHLSLFKKYWLWLALGIALICFAPHLWWQYQHDWISFRYHLFESNVNAYHPVFTIEYITGQLVLAGPIAGIILLPAALLYRPKNALEKALRFTMIGIYAFFFLGSFRGKVEINWTSPALVPVFILAHRYLDERIRWQKILYKLLPLTLLLVMVARIIMIVDILPVPAIENRYHAWKSWPAEMKKRTKGLPVVFSNSYQRASKYWFYTGQMTFSQTLYKEHRNNYDLWPVEDSMLGKPVYYMDLYDRWRFPDSLKTVLGWIGYRYEASFASFAKLRIVTSEKSYEIKQGDSLLITAESNIPQHYRDFISQHPDISAKIIVGIFNKKEWVKDIETPLTLQQITNGPFSFNIDTALPKGKYYLIFGIRVDDHYPTNNSERVKFKII